MNALEVLIREEIAAQGPMRFDRFMALALYHPTHGYYAAPRPIGRAGDYMTSVSVGPLFGRLLAWQAREMAERLGAEPVFWIIEQGAHDGQLARDILMQARQWPDFFDRLRYLVVEPPGRSREAQRQMLADFAPRVAWIENLQAWQDDAPAGLFLTNELADAMPVRAIVRGREAWLERRVTIAPGDRLDWCDRPIDDDELQAAIREAAPPEVPGYRTEIGLEARAWMLRVARFLRRGYALTFDYGFPARLYYAPFRDGGTLTCYRGHRRGDGLFDSPGEQDITAHVDFSALARAGSGQGLPALSLVDQGRFLVGVLQGTGVSRMITAGDAPALQMLTHPEHLGARFQALVQARDAPDSLAGLAFARRGGFD